MVDPKKWFKVRVDVRIYSQDTGNNYPLTLSEEIETDLATLSDAAAMLVKLHEFFETFKTRRKQ